MQQHLYADLFGTELPKSASEQSFLSDKAFGSIALDEIKSLMQNTTMSETRWCLLDFLESCLRWMESERKEKVKVEAI